MSIDFFIVDRSIIYN